jgi:Spy/CpxP family protein refolding chaperone
MDRRLGRGIFPGMRLGVAIAGVFMAASALSQAPGDGMGSKPGFGEHRPPFESAMGFQGTQGRFWNNPKIVAALKLTDDQRKAMDAILLEHRERLIDLRASVEKAELGMEPLMGQDQPDEARILAQIDNVAQARAELEKANARFLLALRGKLTPDQWKQVQAFRRDHAQERHGWAGEGRMRGGPGHDGQGPDGQFQHQLVAPPPPPPPAGPQGELNQGPALEGQAAGGQQ